MISAVCWIPKGASKVVPESVEPPTQEEIEELTKSGALERSNDSEEEEEQDMEMDGTEKEVGGVARALAAVKALGKAQGDNSSYDLKGTIDALGELDMDHYDDEDDEINVLSSGLSDVYYPSNDMDPYLQGVDDDDDEDVEDMTIKPTDAVIVCACNEDEYSSLQVSIFEELEDKETNLYVNNEIILSAFPLCTAWLDCNLKGGESGDKGNFIAVGSMEPAIEIWDLDLPKEVQPFMVLGGISKKKTGKKTSVKYKRGSHRDSVLGLAWNKVVRNALASASADKTVKVWDMVTGKCTVTLDHHTDKVQAVTWSRYAPEILVSGSFDHTVALMDVRFNDRSPNTWQVSADVESVELDPHSEHLFAVSLDNGTVQAFDARTATSDSTSGSRPIFTLHAHEKAVTSIAYNPAAPNLLATGSMDKKVKLWDLSNNQPSCVASTNPKAGSVFSLAFSEDCPFQLAVGGSKGKLKVWDILTDHGVANKFGKFGNRGTETALVG
ncbi:periodic tryptophan protein 1 [Dioscorea alata]|uniref:Periodic tryptophan protein 1 n=2 Tax=Dioscorea alata TaxID=55571 RepID=A0ACB7UEU9_DIOAL|nr:periodic tryptophan protein 1 [Dioscorea alata]KAH7658809.1 periodic tryptophan protein 1 [Dioscorea alata]